MKENGLVKMDYQGKYQNFVTMTCDDLVLAGYCRNGQYYGGGRIGQNWDYAFYEEFSKVRDDELVAYPMQCPQCGCMDTDTKADILDEREIHMIKQADNLGS